MHIVTYGGAVSLDGFLAGVDGSIDWLHFKQGRGGRDIRVLEGCGTDPYGSKDVRGVCLLQ